MASRTLLAEVLDELPDQLDEGLTRLVHAELVKESKLGLRLTPAGKDAADSVFWEQQTTLPPGLIDEVYASFEAVNTRCKTLVSQWQVREVDGETVPNDHSDAEYDQAIIDGIHAIYRAVKPALVGLAEALPRISAYPRRFERALEQIGAGDLRYLAAPMLESFHTVWFELHEELIRLSGRTRADEAAAGRAD
ncbi:MAG: hypothetical protein EA371_12805 [Gammaproteobacteria bacterium]|nr:MAG: hypothetical protein EA371_12805 [Gammaproteobacteria bacterium]